MEWFSCVFLSLYSKQKIPQWAFVNFGWSARIVIPNTAYRAPFTSLRYVPNQTTALCGLIPKTPHTKIKKYPQGVFFIFGCGVWAKRELRQCFHLCIPISKSRTSGKWSDISVFMTLKSLTLISSVTKI